MLHIITLLYQGFIPELILWEQIKGDLELYTLLFGALGSGVAYVSYSTEIALRCVSSILYHVYRGLLESDLCLYIYRIELV